MERDAFLRKAVDDGKILPASVEGWEARYEENAEMVRGIITDLPEAGVFLREFGSDATGAGTASEEERELGDALDRYMGVESEAEATA